MAYRKFLDDNQDPAQAIRERIINQQLDPNVAPNASPGTSVSTPSPDFSTPPTNTTQPAGTQRATTPTVQQPPTGGTQGGVDPVTGGITYYNPTGPATGTPSVTFDTKNNQFLDSAGAPITSVQAGVGAATGSGNAQITAATPQPGETPAQFFARLANSGMPRQAAMDATDKAFGLSPANRNSSYYDPAKQAVGYTDAYVALGPDGQWHVQPRLPENFTGTQNGVAGTVPGAQASNPFLDAIKQILMQRIAVAQQPVDEQSPEVAQPFAAAKLQAQRQSAKERNDLAERLYASGDLNTAALDQGIQQSNENVAVGLAGLKAQLITQQLQAKRQELSDDLRYAIAIGDGESARQIQLALAALDAQLRREGYGVNLAAITAQQNSNAGLDLTS